MTENVVLWWLNRRVEVRANLTEPAQKIAAIKNYLFVLSISNTLYKGQVQEDQNGKFIELTVIPSITALDIDSYEDLLYIVDCSGTVLVCDVNLVVLNEITLLDHFKCPSGHTTSKVKVIKLAVNQFGALYISEHNQLWASGKMPHVGISSDQPKKVEFFSQRVIHSVAIGAEFAVILVSKQPSNDLENLCQICFTPQESVVEEKQEEKNIIVRNTEAAKEFLTKQISRMSTVSEEYLIECAEKPTRILKENMTSVASLVYEGVKSVGDKVATLSRHVSLGSEAKLDLKMSKEDFMLSSSQSTSETNLQDEEIEENTDFILMRGSGILDREVWMWGVNASKEQLPVIISTLSRQAVSKVSLEQGHACAVTLDGRAFLWGRNDHHQVTFDSKATQLVPKLFPSNLDERVLDAACASTFTAILTNKTNLTYLGRSSQGCQTIYHKFMDRVAKSAVKPYNHLIVSRDFCLFNPLGEGEETLLGKEQLMLEEMITVDRLIMKLLSKKTSKIEVEKLSATYRKLLQFTTVNVRDLLECFCGIIEIAETTLIRQYKEFLNLYKEYTGIVQDLVSINEFEHLSTLVTVSPQLNTLRSGVLNNHQTKGKEVLYLVQSPLRRLPVYYDFYRKFPEIHLKWKELCEVVEAKSKEAERTANFWKTTGKPVIHLQIPERRFLSDKPITLHPSSRFSTHRFILFSDIFLHLSSSQTQVFDLRLIWLDLPQHDSLHLITLKTPEETLTLLAEDGETKWYWFHALQQAIKSALNKPDLLQPPLARKGGHVFKTGFFKDALYSGRWFNGKMHGTGRLEWPDGRVYTGHFMHSCMSGFGVMVVPDVGTYEGEWKDNKEDGYGVYTYSNNDIYKGYFKDGARHGHGLLRKGNFTTNSASVYIGQWIAGKQSGYGVLDDIATGEKYLGNWFECKRQGSGVIITSEGTYYEGNFQNDSLCGRGIMILEDGLHYEGEFKATGVLGGKGLVTLPSGHTIEGSLSGSLEEGVRIASGILCKHPVASKPFGTFCTPASEKWQALFRHCHDILGLESDVASPSETPRIWQNVAVYLTSASTQKKAREEANLLNSLNNLDVIPPFGRDCITTESYGEIRSYLNRAFDSSCHPLGSLLDNLTEAYVSSYSGKIHPILVNHAINEIIDVTRRVYSVVRFLFPGLPGLDDQYQLTSTEIVSYQSLLYPVILPRVYNCLCTLLSLKNESQERQYKKKLIERNKLSDRSLMSVLSVEKKFLDLEVSAFAEAIETLQQIITVFLPIEKLTVIRSTIDHMTQMSKRLLGGNYVWNMDDLFPLFLYVVVRARIPHLGAELDFMEQFMDQNLDNGELGIMFTTLKACYQQILQEKTSP